MDDEQRALRDRRLHRVGRQRAEALHPVEPADGDAEATTEDVWDKTLAINVKGVWLGCKYGIPALRRAGGGSIINTASFVAILGALFADDLPRGVDPVGPRTTS